MKKKLYHQFACSSLMLPEHRALLAEHVESYGGERRGKKVLCERADEQQMEQLQRLLEQSIRRGLPLKIRLIEKGEQHILTGVVLEIQPHQGRLRLQCDERIFTIAVDAITDLEALDRRAPAAPERGRPKGSSP